MPRVDERCPIVEDAGSTDIDAGAKVPDEWVKLRVRNDPGPRCRHCGIRDPSFVRDEDHEVQLWMTRLGSDQVVRRPVIPAGEALDLDGCDITRVPDHEDIHPLL